MEKKEGVEKDGTEKAKRADRREGGEGGLSWRGQSERRLTEVLKRLK